MSTYDSAYCLAWLRRVLARPSADEIPDATYYQWLNEAQNRCIADIASRAPWVLYPKVGYASMPKLATTDNQVWTFLDSTGSATDSNGYPVMPFGKAKIFTSLSAIPDNPWIEGVDYLQEGNQVRLPNNRTYSGTLYWRGIQQPTDIDATHQPALIPEASRELIVNRAVVDFSDAGGLRADLAGRFEQKYAEAFSRWMLVWKTQFASGGALAYANTPIRTDGSASGYIASILVSP